MSEVEDGKLCAILAWIFPIGLIWYFADEKMKKNKFVAFHVKQSLVLFIAAVILQIIVRLLSFLWLWFLMYVAEIVIVALFLFGIIKAINGKTDPLPVIGKYGESFKF
ncbi:MAG TPA: hypothetical protein VI564_05575 [Candidatus Nanoarchaeia archaeon]|nr:hypothetical protein [Candidatus Nanoarchaeia archaeon]